MASVHGRPLKVLLKRVHTNIFLHQAKLSRDRSPFPHDAPQATVHGEDWPIPASRERTDDSDLEADINLDSLGMRYDLEMSPRPQNSKDPESLRSSVVRNVQSGKVIWCREDKLQSQPGCSGRRVASDGEVWDTNRN